jgi:hypothetical protein
VRENGDGDRGDSGALRVILLKEGNGGDDDMEEDGGGSDGFGHLEKWKCKCVSLSKLDQALGANRKWLVSQ